MGQDFAKLAMAMKNLNLKILSLFVMALLAAPIASHAADNGRPADSGFDDWDDDMWSDWGAQPGTNKVTDKKDDASADTAQAPAGSGSDFGLPSASNNFGAGTGGNSGVIRFRLVRDGDGSDISGPRKNRPVYGKRKQL